MATGISDNLDFRLTVLRETSPQYRCPLLEEMPTEDGPVAICRFRYNFTNGNIREAQRACQDPNIFYAHCASPDFIYCDYFEKNQRLTTNAAERI